MRTRPPAAGAKAFDVAAFLDAAATQGRTVRYASGSRIFAQGGAATSVFYLQIGRAHV